MGKRIPNFYGGLNNTFKFKNFDFSFLFQFVKQYGYYPSFYPGYTGGAGSSWTYMPYESLNRWQKPGDITDVPRATTGIVSSPANTSVSFYRSSSKFFGDASFVRLKNIALSYTLSEKMVKKLKMDYLRLNVTMQNLLTFSRYPGIDPEAPYTTLPTIPFVKTVTLGLQVGL
jgi:hypothetical protein